MCSEAGAVADVRLGRPYSFVVARGFHGAGGDEGDVPLGRSLTPRHHSSVDTKWCCERKWRFQIPGLFEEIPAVRRYAVPASGQSTSDRTSIRSSWKCGQRTENGRKYANDYNVSFRSLAHQLTRESGILSNRVITRSNSVVHASRCGSLCRDKK